MIVKPVFIIGAPRSGTSLLQKILRGHPAFWSLPSESDIIWDQFCHPSLRGWESECMSAANLTGSDQENIRRQFEKFLCPSNFWKPVEKTNLIWGFWRMQRARQWGRWVYKRVFPLLPLLLWHGKAKRFIDKTASNCFRLDYINAIFPDSKIVYPLRDGRNTVNSLMHGWLHPTRFFTYDVPAVLGIKGYPYRKWKFVLPPGWRDYITRPLEEVCAFQWRSCHEAMLAETSQSKYTGRVFRIKLEDLIADPEYWLRHLSEFIELPYDEYFQSIATNMPIVNSPDNDVSLDKWKHQHRAEIEHILPMIAQTMQQLDYEL